MNINMLKSTIGYARFLHFLTSALLIASSAKIFSADIFSLQSGNWSNPGVWSSNNIPGQGDNVLIDSSHVVVYDVESSAEIRLIHIRGKLEFSRNVNTRLDAGMIILSTSPSVNVNMNCSAHHHGPHWMGVPSPTLEVGTWDNPIPDNVTTRIRLVYFSDMSSDCAPGIISYGGKMEFHGAPMNKTWVKLGSSAHQGSHTVTLAEPVDWQVGDHVIVTGTNFFDSHNQVGSYRTNGRSETEERTITAIQGNTITLNNSLHHTHDGKGDTRGEVGNLSRNVIIESKNPNGVRGHTMYHLGSQGSISYAEFAHLGKAGVLARYPIHFHVVQSSMRGSSVIGASIWDSHNRWVTIHGTNYLVVKDCIGYKSRGHGFFMENASEVFNVLENNLGVLAYNVNPLPNQALDYDENDGAAYWWANGRNTFIDNVAVECDGAGFWLDIPDHVRTSILQPDGTIQSNVQVNRLPFVRFENNEIHGSVRYGYWLNGDGQVNNPFVVKNSLIWRSWYPFSLNGNNYLVENLNLWRTAYGWYSNSKGNESRNTKVVGFTARRVMNTTFSVRKPGGLMTFENVVIDSAGEYPWMLTGRYDHTPADVHVRNYSMTHIESGHEAAQRHKDGDPSPDYTLYLHDWFGNNQDAKIIPNNQTRNDNLNYSTMPPDFATGQNGVLVAPTNVSFPESPIDPIDNLPPATVILYPAKDQVFSEQTDQITVVGNCTDASNVTSVTVNGVQATPLAANFKQWEVTVNNLSPGEVTLEAKATDEFGNVELNPHKIKIGVGVVPVGTEEINPQNLISGYELRDNYPNPFNPQTTIQFYISDLDPGNSHVRLMVFDLFGKQIRELVNDNLGPGLHEAIWNGRDEYGNPVASGVYFYTMLVDGNRDRFRQTKKMVLLK